MPSDSFAKAITRLRVSGRGGGERMQHRRQAAGLREFGDDEGLAARQQPERRVEQAYGREPAGTPESLFPPL